ncbi:19982_t:CDS:2, partial [Racocetra persica]
IIEGPSEEPMKKKQKYNKEKKSNTRKSLTGIQKAEICNLKQKGVSQVKLAKQFANTALQTISGTIVKRKATQLAEGLEVTDFNASDGWLSNFKKRHHIKEYKYLGEDASAPFENLFRFRNTYEYVIADNNLITTEMPTDEEIIEAVKNRDCIEPDKEKLQKPISPVEALRFICGILTFLEEQPDGSFKVDDSLIQNLGKLKKE